MRPDDLLLQIRDQIAILRAAGDPLTRVVAGSQLSEAFAALDAALSSGIVPPDDWNVARQLSEQDADRFGKGVYYASKDSVLPDGTVLP